MQCQVEIPAVKGLKDNEITVGREFILSCSGEWPKNWIREKSALLLPEGSQYQLKLLDFEFRSADRADLKVTSYRALPADIKLVKITDGVQTIELGPVQFNVASVIEKPQDPQQKVEPYGPMGPVSLSIPNEYYLFFLVTLLLIFFAIFNRIFQSRQRKKLIERLAKHDSAMSPLTQFHHSIRKLKRENEVYFGRKADSAQIQTAFTSLQQMFTLYVMRELKIPADEWSDKQILRELKKYHKKLALEKGSDFKVLLVEFKKAKGRVASLDEKDILVLTEKTQKLIDQVDRLLHQKEEK